MKRGDIMRMLTHVLVLSALLSSGLAAQETDDFKDWHADWSVQKAVNDAQLILVAKVTHVGKVKVVEGAKTDRYFREFRFQPIKQIKGIYSRGELVMSASDLGCSSSTGAAANDIREGQYRVLMLSQSNPVAFGLGGIQTFGCVTAPNSKNFRQSVPLLSGEDDPIVTMLEAMCRIPNMRSRQERARMLVDALNAAQGPAVVPLMTALRQDAMWAAANPSVIDPLVRLSTDPSTPIRTEAVRTIAAILAWSNNADIATDQLGFALREFLDSDQQRTEDRVRAIQALKYIHGDDSWRADLLHGILRQARSYEERFAAAEVLGSHPNGKYFFTLAEEFAEMPLDANAKHVFTMAHALLTTNREAAAPLLIDRFRESLAAGQSVNGELNLFTQYRIDSAVEEILEAIPAAPRAVREEMIGVLGQLKATQAIPQLIEHLDSLPTTVTRAKQALLTIGTRDAAIALRSHLKTESDLITKLRIAALLAQHGFDDGYSLAIEHLADRMDVSLLAADVLASMDHPRSEKQLKPILEGNPGPNWFAAALAGLLVIGDEDARSALVGILKDERHPIIVKAAEYAHLATDEAVSDAGFLQPLTKHIESRNNALALAALRSHAKIMQRDTQLASNAGPSRAQSEIRLVSTAMNNQAYQAELLTTLKRVLGDAYIDRKVRTQALNVLAMFPAEETSDTVLDLLDRTELQGSNISARLEALVRDRGIRIP